MPWFKNRLVLKMKEVHLPNSGSAGDAGFLCLASKPYDNKLTLLHTDDPDFEIVIPRLITTSNYTVNDLQVTKDGFAKILSVRDGELFLDVVDLNNPKAQTKGTAQEEAL